MSRMRLIPCVSVVLTHSEFASGFVPLAPRFLHRRVNQEAEVSGEKYVNPVTGFFGSLLPSSSPSKEEKASAPVASLIAPEIDFATIDWDAMKVTKLPAAEIAERLDNGLRDREWFVTGKVLPQYFSDNFLFKDPDVSLTGIKEYGEGVRKIFDQSSARGEVASCAVNASVTPIDGASAVVTVLWRLSGKVNLGPNGLTLKPFMVTTNLHLEATSGLVMFQEDEFSVPPWDILLGCFFPNLPFLAPPAAPVPPRPVKQDQAMQRPALDWFATALLKLENARVGASSETDAQGRNGEPMAWADAGSLANALSEVMASGPGYAFKQFVADRVAGDYDEAAVNAVLENHIHASVNTGSVALFSFTTCPFCRKAKDMLEAEGVPYVSLELDERADGNALRAALGKRTGRTSVPNVFVQGESIGGCNDGNPGLVKLLERDPGLKQALCEELGSLIDQRQGAL